MKIFIAIILVLSNVIGYAQNEKIKGLLSSSDSTELNIITTKPDEFPNISIVFEALKNGKPTFGLDKNSIRVFEDDVRCQVVKLEEISVDMPINISLILDHSGSMAEDYSQLLDTSTGWYIEEVKFEYDSLGVPYIIEYPEGYVKPIDNAKKAILSFINNFNSTKDSIQLIGFSSRVDITSKFSINKEYLKNITNSINADSSTAFLDALEHGINELKGRKGINVILALTDGLDNSSHVNKRNIIKQAVKHKIPIFNVGLGAVDKPFLKSISNQTKGAFFYTKNSNSLVKIYEEIQQRIHSIYNLTYSSENLNLTDTNRKVEIQFDIDSIYLKKNTINVTLSKETVNAIQAKRDRRKYKMIGYSITGVALGAGLLIFTIRRRRTKKKA